MGICIQDINLFNEMNPSGDVVMSEGYTRFLIALIIVGVIVMVKRVIVALILGKKKYGKLVIFCLLYRKIHSSNLIEETK
jgi:hypothetical protein